MSEDTKKKDDAIGIGHNREANTFSQGQYDKLLNSLHWVHKYARQQVEKIAGKYDSAFTGYWKGYGDKLKTHEKHEQRLEAVNLQSKFTEHCEEHIANLEAKAKAQGIEIPHRETDPEEDKNDDQTS